MDSKYWDKVYQNKSEKDVSWFQEVPAKSMELISEFGLGHTDSIIDIGAGESRFIDTLLAQGYKKISILDISSVALEKVKARLPAYSNIIQLIVSDVREFKANEKYMLWHDRATFHFLTNPSDIDAYLKTAYDCIAENGYLIVSTFSKTGPDKCSGLPTAQYSDNDLKLLFNKYFENMRCFEDAHVTPWNSVQNFVYCGFKKRRVAAT